MQAVFVAAEGWGSALWSLSWQVAVLIPAVWLVSLCCKRQSASFRYLLWCVVLVRLFLPVNLELPFGLGGHVEDAVDHSLESVFEEHPLMVSEPAEPAASHPVQTVEPRAVELPEDRAETVSVPPVPVVNKTAQPEVTRASVSLSTKLLMAWGSVVLFFAAVVIGRVIKVYLHLRRQEQVSDSAFLNQLDGLRAKSGIRRAVKVYACDAADRVGAPCVFGLFRPCLLVPRQMVEEWDNEAREPVLLHELAHIKRFDLAVNALQIIAQILFFFHPLVWFANHRIRHERELACDDLAIAHCGSRRKRYSESILRVVEEARQGGPAFACASIGITEQRSSLGKRIVRIMSENYRMHKRMGVLSILLLLGLSAICMAVASDRTEPKPEVGVEVNMEVPWTNDCISGPSTPFWRYEMNDGTFCLINPDPMNPAVTKYPVGLWVWPKKLSIMEVTYRAKGLDTEHPDKPVMVFSRENSDDVTVLFMSDLKVDGRKHTLRIDLTERMAEMDIRKQRIGYFDIRVHKGKADEGWLKLSRLRFEPRDGVKLPPEKKEDFLTHVRVVDLAGEPIPDATVSLDSHLLNCTVEMQTDDKGRVAMQPVMQGGMLLQRSVLVSKPGYVSTMYKNDYGMGRSQESEIVAILSPAQSISGIVIDEAGQPLANAIGKIGVSDGPDLGRIGHPGMGNIAWVVSDAKGRWSSPPICAAPGVRVDVSWKKMGYYHDILAGSFNPSDAQANNAKAVLKRAMVVSGRITDETGNPVVNASVAHGNSHYDVDYRPVRTDVAGKYVFNNIPEGELVLTVSAEGYAPELAEIMIKNADMISNDFILKQGMPFRFRVVDTEGKPIKGAEIVPSKWRGCQTLEGRLKTDGKGEAVWKGPSDSVEFNIYMKGKMSQQGLTYGPSEGDGVHEVVMKPAAKMVLIVNDAETGAPIKDFQVVEGHIYENAVKNPHWRDDYPYLPKGENGRWEHAFSDVRTRVLRIGAAGYAPVVTEELNMEQFPCEIEISLFRGNPVRAKLVDAEGKPVSGVLVNMLDADTRVTVHGGWIDEYFRKASAITDSAGMFSFPPVGTTPFRLLISSDEGYWYGDRSQFESGNGIVKLLPWASVSGQVLVGNKPVPGQIVHMSSSSQTMLMHSLDAECDSDGRFVHRKVPPGEYRIGRRIKIGRMSTTARATTHEIEAGDKLCVNIGGSGCPVTGVCLFDNESTRITRLMLATIKMENGERKTGSPWIAGEISDDGHFRFDNVMPGEYELHMVINERSHSQRDPFGELIGTINAEVVVPELPDGVQYLETPLDIGQFDMQVSGEGRQVVGRCAWDGDEKHTTSLYLTQTGLEDSKVKLSYSADVGENGWFSIENVSPGRYEVNAGVYVRSKTQGSANPFNQRRQVGELKVQIEVPELTGGENPETPVDLGELKIEPKLPEKAEQS